MPRVLIVSNRLPVTVRASADCVVERCSGGLATGLKSVHEDGGGQWIGWPGSRRDVPADQEGALDQQLAALLPTAMSFHVGPGPSRARLRLRSTEDVRAMLEALARSPS